MQLVKLYLLGLILEFAMNLLLLLVGFVIIKMYLIQAKPVPSLLVQFVSIQHTLTLLLQTL
jgi:hypothetical protein